MRAALRKLHRPRHLQVRWNETALSQAEFLKMKPNERATIEAVLGPGPTSLRTTHQDHRAQATACRSIATISALRSMQMRPICWITNPRLGE